MKNLINIGILSSKMLHTSYILLVQFLSKELLEHISNYFRFCTFNNRDDKFFWLLLPILVMLILNTLMFIYIVTEICRLGSKSKNI